MKFSNLLLIVQDNWQTRIVDSYKNWDAPQLQSYLTDTGKELDKKRKNDKNWLVRQVKSGWHETEKTAETAFESMKDWVFDSWSESQLKAFLDRHGIPNPTPRTRDTLLASARNNYQNVANKLGETSAYPGNWLYESWSESDLKRWLDERGYPVPKPTSRDKLIAVVRRNSRLASIKAAKSKDSVKETISDTVFDTWSDSKLKEFLNKNNVNIPHGSTKNELLALARRNKAYLTGDTAYNSISSTASSTTSVIGNKASQAADTRTTTQWSGTRLKAYLDSRGVPVPQASKRDELLAKDNLKAWLEARGQKMSDAAASRDELYSSAAAYYSSASASAASAGTSIGSKATDAAGYAASKATDAAGGAASQATDSAASAASAGTEAVADASKQAYASLTSVLAQATANVKEATFDTWSDSELKSYLDTYNIKTYQGSTRNEMIAMARRNATISDTDTILSLLGYGSKAAQKAGNRAYESAQVAKDAAKEKATQAKDHAKEEL
ncbi:hypothetical protein BDD12DRAFT_916238 [Trichophaea hybrida]|nr:hypothetical protein BDD12DRAFT_916238 [Trichophaea hybrida]